MSLNVFNIQKDVIDKIDAEAAHHAERIQASIDREKAERSARLSGDSKLSQEDGTDPTRDNNQEQLPESADIVKSLNERQQSNTEVEGVSADSENVLRIDDIVQYEKKSDINVLTSSATPCSPETRKSPEEDLTTDTEHTSTKVTSISECVHQEGASPNSPDTAETPVVPETGGEGDLEDWLDDFLNEDD